MGVYNLKLQVRNKIITSIKCSKIKTEFIQICASYIHTSIKLLSIIKYSKSLGF